MTSPTRKATNPRNRRMAQIVLGLGGGIGLICFLGSTWTGRLGIGIVFVAAFIVADLARRETRRVRLESHADRLADHERRHAELTYERHTSEALVDMLHAANFELAHTVLTLRSEAAWRQIEMAHVRTLLSTLRGDNAALAAERDGLRDKIAALEEVSAEEKGAEIFALPRRVLRHQRKIWDDEQVWGTDSMPSVTALVADDATTRPAATPAYRKQA